MFDHPESDCAVPDQHCCRSCQLHVARLPPACACHHVTVGTCHCAGSCHSTKFWMTRVCRACQGCPTCTWVRAVQGVAGRCIPVLPQHTFPGDVVISGRYAVGLAPPAVGDPELDKLCLGHLTAAARAAFAAAGSDAHPPPSPEDGRSTDGDESDHLSGTDKQLSQ